MITVKSEGVNYLGSLVDKGILVDVAEEKGGRGAGISPYELLEAALASCMNITLRMSMEKHNIAYDNLEITVKLNKSDPDKTIFEYSYKIDSNLDEIQKAKILRVLEQCPVKKALAKEIEFMFMGSK